jgi:hypothetical protein
MYWAAILNAAVVAGSSGGQLSNISFSACLTSARGAFSVTTGAAGSGAGALVRRRLWCSSSMSDSGESPRARLEDDEGSSGGVDTGFGGGGGTRVQRPTLHRCTSGPPASPCSIVPMHSNDVIRHVDPWHVPPHGTTSLVAGHPLQHLRLMGCKACPPLTSEGGWRMGQCCFGAATGAGAGWGGTVALGRGGFGCCPGFVRLTGTTTLHDRWPHQKVRLPIGIALQPAELMQILPLQLPRHGKEVAMVVGALHAAHRSGEGGCGSALGLG